MAYQVKGAPFRYPGAKNVEDCVTAEDCIVKAGLDWDVQKCELVAKMPAKLNDSVREDGFLRGGDFYREFNDAYATYRTDINIPLGLVGAKYTPVQNSEAFSFFNDAIGKDKALWQTAGYFGNGERIFISAKLPDNIFVQGDPVENYLVFTTSHDGSTGVKILFTPIRVICENTLNAAIRTSTNFISIRHTQSVHDKMDLASDILGICKNQTKLLGELYTAMNAKKYTDVEAQDYFAQLILSDNELALLKQYGYTPIQLITRNYNAIEATGVSMKKVNVLADMYNYYHSGIGQREILGTGWGLYNAVTGYYSNVDNAIGTKRMDSLLFGDKSRKIEKAGNLVLSA